MRLVREQRNNLFHSEITSCTITNESTDASTITPQSRTVFMILLRFYVRSYLGGVLEVSILVCDQGTYPDGDREVYDSSDPQLLEINKPEEHLSLPAGDILLMKWWIDLYRHRETSSALLWISAWAYQRSGRRNLHPATDDDLA